MITYPAGLVQATFSRKARRFTAVCIVNENTCEAHIPTSGRMAELLLEGAECLLQPSPSTSRQTAYSLVAVKTGDTWVSVDSTLPNKLVRLYLQARMIPELSDYTLVRSEHTLGQSRFDFLLSRNNHQALLEVKSVTYVHKGAAMFPDAPTSRGKRHLEELIELRINGFTPIVVFVAQRADAEYFTPYAEIDPAFALALEQAHRCGVRILAYKTKVTPQGVTMIGAIPARVNREI